MDWKDWDMLNNITFKTLSYRKNFDIVNINENIITEYDGTISELRINEYKSPRIVGEYGFSIWNIELGKKFNTNFNRLIKEHSIENTYSELMKLIEDNIIDIKKYKKLILLHTLVIRSDYRKRGITEEFVEFIYREFYDKDNLIIALVKPFQDNLIDANYYLKSNFVDVKDKKMPSNEIIRVPASTYYSLNELIEKKDVEKNEYKLFSIAIKCGFDRLNNSHLFMFSPEKTISRMMKKIEKAKIQEIDDLLKN